MAQAKKGDRVKVHYTGRLDDGAVFDSSECGDCSCESTPLEFVIGEGNIIPGFEQGVLGMSPGESKTVVIPPAEAYGDRVEEVVATLNKSELPADLNPQVGHQLEVTMQNGESLPVMVTEVTEDTITLDANHPLAGKTLTFDIKLVEIA